MKVVLLLKQNKIVAASKYIHAYRLGSRKAAMYLMQLIQSEGFFKTLKNEVDKENPDATYVWAGLVALGLDYQLSNEQALALLEKGIKKITFIQLLKRDCAITLVLWLNKIKIKPLNIGKLQKTLEVLKQKLD